VADWSKLATRAIQGWQGDSPEAPGTQQTGQIQIGAVTSDVDDYTVTVFPRGEPELRERSADNAENEIEYSRQAVEDAINYSGASVPEVDAVDADDASDADDNAVENRGWIEAESIVCARTGEILGYGYATADDDFAESAICFAALESPNRGINPRWRNTSPEALDNLAELDCEGFAVYALAMLANTCRKQSPRRDGYSAIEFDAPARATSLWCLARARRWIDVTPAETVSALNRALVNVLSHDPKVVYPLFVREVRKQVRELPDGFDARYPDWLARAANAELLTPLLQRAYGKALAAAMQNEVSIRVWARERDRDARKSTPVLARNLGDHAAGNIKKMKRASKSREQASAFAELFAAVGLTDVLKASFNRQALAELKSRTARNQQSSQSNSLAATLNKFRREPVIAVRPEPEADTELLRVQQAEISINRATQMDGADPESIAAMFDALAAIELCDRADVDDDDNKASFDDESLEFSIENLFGDRDVVETDETTVEISRMRQPLPSKLLPHAIPAQSSQSAQSTAIENRFNKFRK
jgi:hypothetical protein